MSIVISSRFVKILVLFCFCCLFVDCNCRPGESKEEQVASWLTRYPVANPYMRSSEPVPYDSYEEWIDAGRKIEGIEQILIGFAKNNTTKVSTGIIFQALGFLGSEDSVPVLINALENEGLDRTKRVYAANALGRIGNPLAVEPLCKIVSTTEDAFLRNNAILALGMIGDTKAISVLEAVLRKPQLDQFDRIEIQKILDELLKK